MRAGKGKVWTTVEVKFLTRYYAEASWAYLLRNLPGRTRNAVCDRACHMKLKRTAPRSRRVVNDPLINQLRARRIAVGVTQRELGTYIGRHITIERCERGANPSYKTLQAWCKALGVELTIRTVSPVDLRWGGKGQELSSAMLLKFQAKNDMRVLKKVQ